MKTLTIIALLTILSGCSVSPEGFDEYFSDRLTPLYTVGDGGIKLEEQISLEDFELMEDEG